MNKPTVTSSPSSGPLGPVGFGLLVALLVAAPWIRGGNRSLALILLEWLAIGVLLALVLRASMSTARLWPQESRPRAVLLAFVVLSPAWLGLLYLTPLPWGLLAAPHHLLYADLLQSVGLSWPAWRALSLAPDSTAMSLLAGLPIVAALLCGYAADHRQLRRLMAVVAVLAFLQLLIAIAQMSGGPQSDWYFGMPGGRPQGSFSNPNHFANYLGLALAGYLALAMRATTHGGGHHGSPGRASALMWTAGAMLLVAGVLMSRSRGAMLALAAAAPLALGIAFVWSQRERHWGRILALGALSLTGALLLVGVDLVLSRFDTQSFEASADGRTRIAETTLAGAAALWPWGAGWGTFHLVYPRFQPVDLAVFVNEAHHEYVQVLFDGGMFGALLMAAAALLFCHRLWQLVRAYRRHGQLAADELTIALCGTGLLFMLLHSWVEFNMRIPANATLAALLAGAYLRPLNRSKPSRDRSTQSYSSRH